MKRFLPMLLVATSLLAAFFVGVSVGKSSPATTQYQSVPRRESVNERLVDDGLATVNVIKGEVKPKYLSRLEAAEARARAASRGLWTPKP